MSTLCGIDLKSLRETAPQRDDDVTVRDVITSDHLPLSSSVDERNYFVLFGGMMRKLDCVGI